MARYFFFMVKLLSSMAGVFDPAFNLFQSVIHEAKCAFAMATFVRVRGVQLIACGAELVAGRGHVRLTGGSRRASGDVSGGEQQDQEDDE